MTETSKARPHPVVAVNNPLIEWRNCTPELLASGVHCPTAPRRPSPDPDRSHQHLVNRGDQ